MENKSITILDDKVVCFDCDDTLVMWHDGGLKPDTPGSIYIKDPYYSGLYGSSGFYLVPHKKHIQKLKGYARSGWFVIIWSAGGGPWANEVKHALKLEDYVNLTMAKPQICYDDLPVGEGIGRRVWYQPKKEREDEQD